MNVDHLVVDTNVLISAALSSHGAPELLPDDLKRARAVLVFSEPTMTELATRLMRAKFDRYVDRDTHVRRNSRELRKQFRVSAETCRYGPQVQKLTEGWVSGMVWDGI